MHIKSRMHPRNIYKNPPNFKQLALQYPDFRQYVKPNLKGKVIIDFKDPKAVKELTRTLLKKDFNLDVIIDETRLIPKIPQSLNYILWVEDLLNILKLESQPVGVDIGTGSVCIYSLLGAKKGWKMLATELDPENLKLAEKNIVQNNLTESITLKQVSDSKDLLIGVTNDGTKYDFCMCNPPFFNYNEEPQNRTTKRPLIETTASEVPSETTTEGGELTFISKLIQESVKLADHIKIYTTLVGKKSDFVYLKKELEKVNPKSMASAEFCQGRTVRWGLAWTFLDFNLQNSSIHALKSSKKNKSKFSMQYTVPSSKAENCNKAFEDVKNVLNKLQIEFKEKSFNKGHTLHFKASENTWSHQRRKKRLQSKKAKDIEDGKNEENEEHLKAKKLRLEKDNDASKSLLLEGVITLKEVNSSVIFEIAWISGEKEALHQIFQYFKNYWKKDSVANP